MKKADKRNILKIDKLQEQEAYTISFLPKKMESERYFAIEELFVKKHISEYARKISWIVLQIWGYYDTAIYLTEMPSQNKYAKYVYKNIAKQDPMLISQLIKYVIKKDISSVEVFIPARDFLLSIGGGLNCTVYNINNEDHVWLKQIVEREGLYLWKS